MSNDSGIPDASQGQQFAHDRHTHFIESLHKIKLPYSTLSGYHIPLKYEVGASPAIIVGRVASVRYVQADPNDPNGITSYVYTVRRLQELKGSVPEYIMLRAENDSGGYRMNAGETNLLFLTQAKDGLTVDVCGNSTELPKGASVVSEVRGLLAHQGAQP